MIDLETFAGPGGWDTGAEALGIHPVGIELDAAACATRRAAGHLTIRADAAAFSTARLAGKVRGFIGSPPCKLYSAAGTGIGRLVLDVLAAAIPRVLGGQDCREEVRAAIYPVALEWRQSENEDRAAARRWTAARIETAARSDAFEASLVLEPARYIAACRPEWVALEQVPAVLPLWQVYAAELRRMGYSAWTGKLNAADYGVPQTRERAILIASRVRQVARPEPTHYDHRKGDQLWGTPWVSMAEALGWGANGRPSVAVTAGGTSTGGAEPFGHRGRDALEAEREAGRWALRVDAQAHASVRAVTASALKFGHSAAEMQWVLRRERSAGRAEHDATRDRRLDVPAPTVSGGGEGRMSWVLHTNRDQRPDGTRQTADPTTAPAPAPALTAKSGGQWVVKGFRNNNNNACERSIDEPAGTLFFGQRSNWAAWVTERPATTVQGDPRVGRPGHKDRDKGERQFEQDSVRITVREAAILQSFPADYPWQGTKTAAFRQVGDAVPPRLAAHILSMATGIPLSLSSREEAA